MCLRWQRRELRQESCPARSRCGWRLHKSAASRRAWLFFHLQTMEWSRRTQAPDQSLKSLQGQLACRDWAYWGLQTRCLSEDWDRTTMLECHWDWLRQPYTPTPPLQRRRIRNLTGTRAPAMAN